MSLQRLRPADWLTGISGLALLVSLWCPWYALPDGTTSAWQSLALIDLWLALTALLGIGVLVATARRDVPAVPVAFDVLCGAVALLALPLMLWRLLGTPDDAITGREWGLFLAAAATLGTFAGSWWAMRDESAPGQRPHPEIEVMEAPPAGAGPEPAARET